MSGVDAFGGTSTQELGEQREEGVVYSVSLKRVRYGSQSTDGHLQWNSRKVRTLKAGTLAKVVDRLAPYREEMDVSYRTCFLSTYRTFASPMEVLQLLVTRYLSMTPLPGDTGEDKARVQSYILSFLHHWLEGYPSDFTPEHTSPPSSTSPPSTSPPSPPPIFTEVETFSRCHAPNCQELARVVANVRKSLLQRQREQWCEEESAGESGFGLFSLSPVKFAASLTAEDATLFQAVEPHQCLAYVRSPKLAHVPTIRKAIEHFNKVSLVTIATSLEGRTAVERGRVLERWVEVAQECRHLKNFSSLRAIVFGLRSSAIYRLQQSWDTLPQEKMELFRELSELFVADRNHQTSRDLLNREGTSKYVETSGKRSKAAHNGVRSSVSGVVPYLGTYLTDLTMVHTALSDTTPDGLINFDKRRKEFEFLAQLMLYQKASANYSLPHSPALLHWLRHTPILTDQESYLRSKMLEPNDHLLPSPPSPVTRSPLLPSRFRRTIRNFFPLKTVVGDSYDLVAMTTDERGRSPDEHTHTITPLTPSQTPGSRMVRIAYMPSGRRDSCLYKSILVQESDRGYDVIRNALEKHGLLDSPTHYQLLQIVEGNKRLLIPANTNAYYALPTTDELTELLLEPIRD